MWIAGQACKSSSMAPRNNRQMPPDNMAAHAAKMIIVKGRIDETGYPE